MELTTILAWVIPLLGIGGVWAYIRSLKNTADKARWRAEDLRLQQELEDLEQALIDGIDRSQVTRKEYANARKKFNDKFGNNDSNGSVH